MKKKYIVILSVFVLTCIFVVTILVNNHNLKKLKHYSDINTLLYQGEVTEEVLEQDEREEFQKYQEDASLNELKLDDATEQEMLDTYGYSDFKKDVTAELGGYPSNVTVSSVKLSNSVIVRATYKDYYITFVANDEFVKGTVSTLGDDGALQEVFNWTPTVNNWHYFLTYTDTLNKIDSEVIIHEK